MHVSFHPADQQGGKEAMTSEPIVYLVDDDPGALQSLLWLVRQAGFLAYAFRSGEEFFAEYRPQEPACLVLDVRMPEIGGLEVQRRLMEVGSDLPIIFVTADGDVPSCAQSAQGRCR